MDAIAETHTDVKLFDASANPAPPGLLGFGTTTILLNIHNAGFYSLNTMILAMGVFYGGIAQVIAGIQEWKKGNTFGATASTSYGLFWLTLVGLLVFRAWALGRRLKKAPWRPTSSCGGCSPWVCSWAPSG